MNISPDHIKQAVAYIKKHETPTPEVGIILGTGLGALINDMSISTIIPYDDIPHFPVSTVETHSGKLIFGELMGKSIVAMQGRFHYYEGYSMPQVVMPVRVMKLLGIKTLFISNAAGALNTDFAISDLMLINDHIDLFPENPLRGRNLDEFGDRFPDMWEAYDPELIALAKKVAKNEGINIQEGIYTGVPGPNLETPAEYRYLAGIGTDAVGMSTIPETIAARHMGLTVLAISVITDLCYPAALQKVSITEIIDAAKRAEPQLTTIFKGLLKEM